MMEIRDEYRKTFTYAQRRASKKLRNVIRLAIEASPIPWLVKKLNRLFA